MRERTTASLAECPECGAHVPGVDSSGPPWFEGAFFECEKGHGLNIVVNDRIETEDGGLAELVCVDDEDDVEAADGN